MQIDLKNKLSEIFTNNEKVAVAVSGGADSMALVLLLQEQYKGEIVALTVDHGLRKESAKEAKKVGKWLEKHKIEHHILKWEGLKPTSNIEAIAREKRYGLLCNFCYQNNIASLFVAHNLNDQAETFLLRLRRSSGLFGLSGMEEISFYKKIRIVRPLLETSRKDLEKYLKFKKQKWVNDSFNKDSKYERVRVRKFLPKLKKLDISSDTIVSSMKLLQADKKIIKEIIKKIADEKIKINQKGFIELDVSIFEEDFSIFIYMLSELFTKLGREIPRAEKIENLYKNKGENTQTLGGLIFYRKKNKLLIAPEYEKIKNLKMEIKQGQTVSFLGFTIISKFDSIVSVLGEKTNKQIQKSNIPSLIKKSLPILIYEGKEIIPFIEKEGLDFDIVYDPYNNYINNF